jgi:17beta-estradiol 17-dehydrogenase / very-long-chain 3-oxoacyl-CoA reductase
LILNVGSFSAHVPSPLLSVYTGSKAFVNAFSQALGCELEDLGITVSLINTYFVVSALSKIRKPNILTPLPGPYVRSVLSHIGTPVGAVSDKPYVSTPYFTHAVAQFFIDHVGTWPLWFWYNKREL